MEYIIILSISGSCMFLLTFLLKLTGREYLTKRWEYFLQKACLFYYMIPLPFVHTFYKDILRALPFRGNHSSSLAALADNEKIISFDGGTFYLNDTYKLSVILFTVWLIVAFLVLCKSLIQYFRFRRSLLRCSTNCEDASILSLFEDLKKEYRIRRHISLRLSDAPISPFTLGFFHPVIVMTREDSLYKQSLILRHELIHNKRCDSIVKILATYIICLHWYNPLSHLLKKAMETVCEMSCDEALVDNMDTDGRSDYARLIVSQLKRNMEEAAFASFLSSPQTKIEERIKIIMKNQRSKKRLFAALMPFLVVGAVLLNTGTAFAYEDVNVAEYENEIQPSDLEVLDSADINFTTEDTTDSTAASTIDACYFIDQNNHVYNVTDSISPYFFCNHTYVSGRYEAHRKFDDGTCRTLVYNAQMCTKCQRFLVGEKIAEYYEKYCPHK